MNPDHKGRIYGLLNSGLPLPVDLNWPSDARGSQASLDEFLASLGASQPTGPVRVVDDEDRPVALINTPQRHPFLRYVIDPRNLRRPKVARRLKSWGPDESRALKAVYGPREQVAPLRSAPTGATASEASATVRLVTVDASAHAAGLRAELFEADDRLVVSAASQLDTMTADISFTDTDNETWFGTGHYIGSALVPFGPLILESFGVLARRWMEGTVEQRAQLTTGDLLCAATARAYDLPLYTTRPTAYRFLKSGLKTVKYGPVRNPGLLDDSDGSSNAAADEDPVERRAQDALAPPQVVVADPAICAATVRSRYQAGADFTDQDRQMVLNVVDDFSEYERLVFAIVGDESPGDLTWTTEVLAHAAEVAPHVRASADRSELVFAVFNVFPSAKTLDDEVAREAYDAALNALAEWGEWQDHFDEMLLDFENTDDPYSAAWYLTLLRLKGVDRETVERERRAIADGLAVRVEERFRQVVAESAGS